MPTLRALTPLLFLLLPALALHAQAGTPPPGPLTDTFVIDPDGTAHITRVVPLPATLSPEARARWSKPVSDAAKPQTLAERRSGTDAWQTGAGKPSAAVYPVKITEGHSVAGVPVRIVDPLLYAEVGPISRGGTGCDIFHYSLLRRATVAVDQFCGVESKTTHPDRILICLYSGGFNSDSGSYTESIPIANLTRTRVVSVLYRLAPEHPYPAALEDAVAVYRDLLKTYKPANIAVYGTSAGALGVFSGSGDMTAGGDSIALFSLDGYSGHLDPPAPNPDRHTINPEYSGVADPHDPVLSPIYSDLRGLAPTLFVTSSRDILLSATANMQRAWARDDVPNQLVVFDGLPHAFWSDVSLPESREAYATMARFFMEHLGRS